MRESAAKALGAIGSPEALSPLTSLLKDEDSSVRAIAELAIEKLDTDSDHKIREAAVEPSSSESIESLRDIAKDANERVPARLSTINGLGKIGTEDAVDILLEILKHEDETYQFRAITALGDTQSDRAIEPLQNRLEKLEQRKADWREIRDEDTASYTEKEMADWRNRLKEVTPKPYLEFELAYAISRIDPKKEGVDLLAHHLAAVRQGAWMGLAKSGSVDLIERLYKKRKTSKTPWFRHAAYRAIDHTLIHIQAFGGEEERRQLKRFLPSITDKETDGVHTRVEWTIDRLKEREG